MSDNIKFKKNYRVELAKTLAGHWYSVWLKNTKGKEKFIGHFPSVTTYLNSYPTSEHLVKWVAEQGFHESRAIRDAAGKAGTRIHSGIEKLLKGEELNELEFTTEEWVKLESFVKWYNVYKPEILGLEIPVFSKKGKYAGRLDCIAKVSGQMYILDWKSSKSIHPSFSLQFSAYAQAIEENTALKIDATAAIQLGAQNKDGYRFVIYSDWKNDYKVFQNVKAVWEFDNEKIAKEAPVLDLPKVLKLEKGTELNKPH